MRNGPANIHAATRPHILGELREGGRKSARSGPVGADVDEERACPDILVGLRRSEPVDRLGGATKQVVERARTHSIHYGNVQVTPAPAA